MKIKNLNELKRRLAFYKKDIADFASKNPGQNRLDYFRAVSMSDLIKGSARISRAEGKLAKKHMERFPAMGGFSSDFGDNIRYEPILNGNLLKICFDYLEGLEKILGEREGGNAETAALKNAIAEEAAVFRKRIKEIGEETAKVPDILAKNLKPLAKNPALQKPKISVITASYNLAPLAEETMRSISNQSCQNFEHIVMDGGSSDGSLELLKKYPNIILVSKKDKGYPDAFFKGVQMAKGEYILQCCISDGLARTNWLDKCVEALDNNPDISVVWGLPGRLSEKSLFTGISKAEFHYSEAPQKEKMFNYWLKEFFFYTEGNLCVRKSALLKCFPTIEEANDRSFDFWIEFAYRFNRLGYLSLHIPMLANFGRIHGNQIGQKWIQSGINNKNIKDYKRKVARYRWKLFFGFANHAFIGGNGEPLPIKWNRAEAAGEYFFHKAKFLAKKIRHYLKPKTYLNFLRRKFPRAFKN